MSDLSRAAAVDRVERLLDTIDEDPMPVPVREVWVYGDVALGVDPVDRLDVYLTKDLLFGKDGDREAEFRDSLGVEGVGKTVSAEWAERFPEYVRANHSGHAAPEKCLAAHLLDEGEPVHLEVCNSGFESNVTQRLKGARMRENYEQILDPRGACLWVDGQRSEETVEKLRAGDLVFPTLAGALEMLGMDDAEAEEAADAVRRYRERQEGTTVRGDVV
ncbi:DUF7095 family protein [Halomarina oriensis]|uniref:Uncharacterized protein n=1 Tax=Halomarina oriensis TaxID=671145 RepID=A0A6B0GRJ5_9EURY|nr:hypothetical protein [Halomarina oriensis]MWG35313.1 hypothetical protein [Halomarina oriensis]